jgi:tRNA nucleotidyltransferase (CCA-adding enzyme)
LIADFLKTNIIPELPTCTISAEITPAKRSVVIDPHHGLNDLIQRKIRAVGTPVDRFTEDALRILRGLRFVNILNQHLPDVDKQNSGFDIEKKTRQGMEKTASLISELSAERCHAELMKVF